VPLITQANYLSLGEVYSKLNLKKSSDRNFFHEWRDVNSELSEQNHKSLDQLRDDLQGIQEYPTDVEIVKMYGLGSVLRLAGMAKDPFLPSAGYRIEIDLNNDSQSESVIHSKVEIIITHPNLWAIVIETKRSSPNVLEALPQTLTYMMASQEAVRPIYGLCTNGTDFMFVKLVKGKTNQYALSDPFSIYRHHPNELYNVVSILKYLGSIVVRSEN
jgi:hypothetical protein